jgi:hypothetical protein
MPNYCNNRITISVKENKHNHLLDELEQEINTKNEFLQVLRPMPDKYNVGEEWYDWRCDNWGTKWEMDYTIIRYENDLIIEGRTAWAPPVIALKYYQDNNPNISINCLYVEPGNCFCGHTTFEPGLMTENHISDMTTRTKRQWIQDNTELSDYVCEVMEDVWDCYGMESDEEGEPAAPIIPESSDIGGLDTHKR